MRVIVCTYFFKVGNTVFNIEIMQVSWEYIAARDCMYTKAVGLSMKNIFTFTGENEVA